MNTGRGVTTQAAKPMGDRKMKLTVSTTAPSAADALAAGWFPSAADRGSDPQAAKAYRRALRRSTAAVELIERDRQQAIAAQVEAAYAEYADQPAVEYRDWVRSAA